MHKVPMRRIGLAVVLIPCLALAPLVAKVQPAERVFRVGVILTGASDVAQHLNKSLGEGLRELGYVEGRNLAFERRSAEGQPERLPRLAAELVQLNLDVIVTGSNPAIAAVKRATTTIPIVMAVSRDPAGSGFITSLGWPGGNITGLANDPAPEIQTKNLELLGGTLHAVEVRSLQELQGAFGAMLREMRRGPSAARPRASFYARPDRWVGGTA